MLDAPPSLNRWTRNRIFGVGAAICAVLALARPSIVAIALIAGFAYAAAAFLRPTERRDKWLSISSWAFVMAALFSYVLPAVALLLVADAETLAAAELTKGLLPFRALVTVAAIGGMALTVSTVLIARAFRRSGEERYRLLSRAGIGVAAFFLLDLPGVISASASWPGREYFWDTPLMYMRIVLGALAGLIVSRAFAWYGASDSGSRSISRASREYLLHAAAASLLLPLLIRLGYSDWRLPILDPTGEATNASFFDYALAVASFIAMPAAFACLSAGFLAASRRAGWNPSHWMRPARTWSRRLLLTWRLPLIWSWLLILIATATIAGYYGFLAAAPAAAHYLGMIWWERGHSRHPV